MPRLIWSPSALLDIQRLYRFLAANDPSAAQKAAGAIRRGIQILARQPEVGRPFEGLDPEYREWLLSFGAGGYMDLYRYDGSTAVILAIRHQKEADY
ncbi:MAG: type II toxin-antitoxin system RelE/ParE family toxin [Candidatus Adiutrix sp.]|jgi:plasmid stabilization system protein ParE|nr:type II toxin-antitoxin system RelE/ParE family toxin [Candidatus Adiutrix sp.]